MFSKLGCLFCRPILLLAVAAGIYGTVVIGFKVPAIGWCVLGILLWWRYRLWRHRGGGYAHGTACLADAMSLFSKGLLGRSGLILGRPGYAARPTFGEALAGLINLPAWQSETAVGLALAALSGRRWGENKLIRIFDYVHIATFASTGAGKGVSVLVINLLSYLRSAVVTDPKGELFRLTGEHRRRKFKHRIVRLDPFGLGGPGADSFNILDLIDRDSPHLIDQARDVASMLVMRTGKETEPYWNDMAELVLTTFIALVAATVVKPERRNLQSVRELVCDRKEFTDTLEHIQTIDVCDGMLRRLGAACSWMVDRELAGVLGSVQRHTNFLDSQAVSACTTTSSFDARELATKRITVYLCLPVDKLVSHAPLQRLWVGGILRAVTMGEANERNRVLFLLDEIGNIGHIQALEDAVTLLRSYGVRLWFFFQSIGQVKACYGEKSQVFMDNISTQQYFGINDYDSADAISKRMGDATIRNTSEVDGETYSYPTGVSAKGESRQRSVSRSVTTSELGRRLLKPEEILCLPSDMEVIFHKNLPPILGKLIRYYDAPEFRWGGVGRSAGLGFSGLVGSLCLLAVSLVFASFVTNMPVPVASSGVRRQAVAYPPWQQPYEPTPFSGGQGLPYGRGGGFPPLYDPADIPWHPSRFAQ